MRSAAEQGDEADEAFGGTNPRAASGAAAGGAASCPRGGYGRGHRFAAYPRCWADPARANRTAWRAARVGPVLTKNSPTETDLSPRRVGRHFRKLACRSDPVGEDLTAGGSTVWSSTPGHDRQALLLSRAVRLGGFVASAGLCRLYGASAGSTESSGPARWFSRTQRGRHDVDRTERRPNKGIWTPPSRGMSEARSLGR